MWRTLGAALALCILLFQGQESFVDGVQPPLLMKDPDLTISYSLDGVSRAYTKPDLGPLLKDNLEPDLWPWQSRPLTALDFLDFLHQIDTQWAEYRRNFIAIVSIRNNQFRWWAYPNARRWCTSRVEYTKQEYEKYAKSHGLKFPDVLFVLNGYDKPLCYAGNCSAPIFSYNKCWDPDDSSLSSCSSTAPLPLPPPANGRVAKRWSPHDDILTPVMNHPFDHLVDYPWSKKANKAFARVGLYAAMAHNCSRVIVHKLSTTPEGKQWLDYGIYKNKHWKARHIKTVPPAPMEDHAKFKYLLNTDGQAASWRLAKLLAINSPIVKWSSHSIEYYYRSLKPGVHYLDVNESSIFRVLESHSGSGAAGPKDSALQKMTRDAQQFAFRYLSQLSRTAYAQQALWAYTGLFGKGELEKLLDALGTGPDGAGEVPSLPKLLQVRQRLRAGGG